MLLQASHLHNRGMIRIGGDDRRAFLQGLISNDINMCVGKKMLYAALLTPQGKFLHDLFIADAGEHFLVDCEVGRADDLIARLKKYKLRSKVVIEDARHEFNVWAIWGDNEAPSSHVYADPRMSELGQRAIMKKAEKPEADIVVFDIYDRHRIMHGAPDGSRDMLLEKSTLLEGNFDNLNGISWSKGCYMGQELTARMHYRSLVKKRMFTVKIEGTIPAPSSLIRSEGIEVGEMRSSCGEVGLALLAIDKMNSPLVAGDLNTALQVAPSMSG